MTGPEESGGPECLLERAELDGSASYLALDYSGIGGGIPLPAFVRILLPV